MRSQGLYTVGTHFTQTCNNEWPRTHYALVFHAGTESSFTVNLSGCWFYFLAALTVPLWTWMLWLLTIFAQECHFPNQVSYYMEMPLSLPTGVMPRKHTHRVAMHREWHRGMYLRKWAHVCHGKVSEVDTGPWCPMGVRCANLPTTFMNDHCLPMCPCARLVFCCAVAMETYHGYFFFWCVCVCGRQAYERDMILYFLHFNPNHHYKFPTKDSRFALVCERAGVRWWLLRYLLRSRVY